MGAILDLNERETRILMIALLDREVKAIHSRDNAEDKSERAYWETVRSSTRNLVTKIKSVQKSDSAEKFKQ